MAFDFSCTTSPFQRLENKKSRLPTGDNERVRKLCTHCIPISRKLLIGFMCKAICSVETRQRERPTKAREEGEDLFITCCSPSTHLELGFHIPRILTSARSQLLQDVLSVLLSLTPSAIYSIGQIGKSICAPHLWCQLKKKGFQIFFNTDLPENDAARPK